MADADAAAAPDAPRDSINDQIRDAVDQVNAIIEGSGRSFAVTAAQQGAVHAITLAIQNAVAQQQHAHILRNAVTAAAANAILEGRREEAEAVLELADKRLAPDGVAAEITALLKALKLVTEEMAPS